MKLRGINFGHVLDASGVRNFDGRGWWYHSWLRDFGLDFRGSTFVAKTTTFLLREGYMPLRENGFAPQNRFPDCVKVKFFKGVALNAVGLSGPGAQSLFDDGMWQRWPDPFFLSFMSVEKTAWARLGEMRDFVKLFKSRLPDFQRTEAICQHFPAKISGSYSKPYFSVLL